MNKPPDCKQLYTTVKVPLKKVLKNYDIVQPLIENLVIECNTFVILGYMFINLYLIHCFNNGI